MKVIDNPNCTASVYFACIRRGDRGLYLHKPMYIAGVLRIGDFTSLLLTPDPLSDGQTTRDRLTRQSRV